MEEVWFSLLFTVLFVWPDRMFSKMTFTPTDSNVRGTRLISSPLSTSNTRCFKMTDCHHNPWLSWSDNVRGTRLISSPLSTSNTRRFKMTDCHHDSWLVMIDSGSNGSRLQVQSVYFQELQKSQLNSLWSHVLHAVCFKLQSIVIHVVIVMCSSLLTALVCN